MANKLDVHVNVEGNNQTVSKFAAFEGGHVTFYNDAGAALTVSFGDTSPLCQGGNPQLTINVAANAHKKLKICDGVAGQSFKYTATVDGAAPEDPILIFESKPILIFDNFDTVSAAAGLLIGLVAGYLIARRLMTRNRPAS